MSLLESVVDLPVSSSKHAGGGPCCGGDGSGDADSRKAWRGLVLAAAVVLIVIALYFMVSQQEPQEPQDLCGRLAQRGWVLFTRDGCSYCTKQMAVLGGSYPKIVECTAGGKLVKAFCDKPPFACNQISGFPSWWHPESKAMKAGLQSQEALEKMAAI